MSQPQFRVVGLQNDASMSLGEMVIRESHHLFPLRIQSLVDVPIRLELESDRPWCIGFQTENSNLDIPSHKNHDQRSNVVNAIDSLIIQPQQETRIVMTVLLDEQTIQSGAGEDRDRLGFSMPSASLMASTTSSTTSGTSSSSSLTSTSSLMSSNSSPSGPMDRPLASSSSNLSTTSSVSSVTSGSTSVVSTLPGLENFWKGFDARITITSQMVLDEGLSREQSGEGSGEPATIKRTESSRSLASANSDSLASESSESGVFVMKISCHGVFCDSILKANVKQISFDNCVVDTVYSHQFSLENRSAVPLPFSVQFTPANKEQVSRNIAASITLYKVSGNGGMEELSTDVIDAFGVITIVIEYRPKFEYSASVLGTLQIENMNNNHSPLLIKIKSNAWMAPSKSPIVVSQGQNVDFGSIYANYWAKCHITLTNTSTETAQRVEIIHPDDRLVLFTRHNDVINMNNRGTGLFEGRVNSQDDLFIPTKKERRDSDAASNVSQSGSRGNDSLHSDSESDVGSDISNDDADSMDSQELQLDPWETVDLTPIDKDTGEDPVSQLILDNHDLVVDHEDLEQLGGNQLFHDMENKLPPEKMKRIRELTLQPGAHRNIILWYRPEVLTNDEQPWKLEPHHFKVYLKSTGVGSEAEDSPESFSFIECSAWVCESLISTSTLHLDLGDCYVGEKKTNIVQILNKSDLPVDIKIEYQSKVVTISPLEMKIAAHGVYNMQIDFLPVKSGLQYRRQVNIINLYNRTNDQTLYITATNHDIYKMAFHSLFYGIFKGTKSTINIELGSLVSNCLHARSFQVKNFTNKEMVLGISTSTDQIQIFQRATIGPSTKKQVASSSSSTSDNRERLIDAFDEKQIDRALVEKEDTYRMLLDQNAEKLFVQNERQRRKQMLSAIEMGSLEAVQTVTVPKKSRLTLYLVYTPKLDDELEEGNNINNLIQQAENLKTVEEFVYFQMLEYDEEHNDKRKYADIDGHSIIRKLPVNARVCKSRLRVNQRSMNFGTIHAHEARQKVLVIENLSPLPLHYSLHMSGSVGSSDIMFLTNNKKGIVQPRGEKELHFIFRPSMAGKFKETIEIRNLRDGSDKVQIVFKARVLKTQKFTLANTVLDTGASLVNAGAQNNMEAQIQLSNTTDQTRTYEVFLDSKNKRMLEAITPILVPEVRFVVQKDKGDVVDLTEIELDIEASERKREKYVNKKKLHKLPDIEKRLEELYAMRSAAMEAQKSSALDWDNVSQATLNDFGEQDESKVVSNHARFSLSPHSVQKIGFRFVVGSQMKLSDIPLLHCYTIPFLGILKVQELRNRDHVQQLTFVNTICFKPESRAMINETLSLNNTTTGSSLSSLSSSSTSALSTSPGMDAEVAELRERFLKRAAGTHNEIIGVLQDRSQTVIQARALATNIMTEVLKEITASFDKMKESNGATSETYVGLLSPTKSRGQQEVGSMDSGSSPIHRSSSSLSHRSTNSAAEIGEGSSGDDISRSVSMEELIMHLDPSNTVASGSNDDAYSEGTSSTLTEMEAIESNNVMEDDDSVLLRIKLKSVPKEVCWMETTHLQVELTNASENAVCLGYRLVTSKDVFVAEEDEAGTLEADETRVLGVDLTPTTTSKLSERVVVEYWLSFVDKAAIRTETLTIEPSVCVPKLLEFDDVATIYSDDGGQGSSSNGNEKGTSSSEVGYLDIGHQYIQSIDQVPAGRMVSITNVCEKTLQVQFMSNLKRQIVFRSMNENGEGVGELHSSWWLELDRGQTTQVLICLDPRYAYEGQRSEGYARQITGGVIVNVFVGEGIFVRDYILRTRGTIGISRLRMPSAVLDLGVVPLEAGGRHSGYLEVFNANALMPAKVQLEYGSGIELDPLPEGWDTLTGYNDDQERSKLRISFSVDISHVGMIQSWIRIVNELGDGSGKEYVSQIRLFCDDHTLGVELGEQQKINRGLSTLEYREEYRYLRISDIAVNVAEGTSRLELMEPDFATMVLTNQSDSPIVIQAVSDLVTRMEFEGEEESRISSEDWQMQLDQWLDVGPNRDGLLVIEHQMAEMQPISSIVRMEPNETVEFRLHVPEPEHLEKRQLKRLLRGNSVSVKRRIAFVGYATDTGNVVFRTMRSRMQYFQSLGSIVESVVELGHVGLINDWKSERFSLTVTNKSHTKLQLEFAKSEDEQYPISGNAEETLEALETRQIELSVDPVKVLKHWSGLDVGENNSEQESAYEIEYDVKLFNCNNRSNVMHALVKMCLVDGPLWLDVDGPLQPLHRTDVPVGDRVWNDTLAGRTAADMLVPSLVRVSNIQLASLQHPSMEERGMAQITEEDEEDSGNSHRTVLMRNGIGQDVSLQLATEQPGPVDPFIDLDVSPQDNVPFSEINLRSREKTWIRVDAIAQNDRKITDEDMRSMVEYSEEVAAKTGYERPSNQTVLVGFLVVTSTTGGNRMQLASGQETLEESESGSGGKGKGVESSLRKMMRTNTTDTEGSLDERTDQETALFQDVVLIWTDIVIRAAVTVRNRRIHFSATGTDVYEGAAFVQNKFPGLPLRFHAFIGQNGEMDEDNEWLTVQPSTGFIEWPKSDQRVRVIADVSKMPHNVDLSQVEYTLHVVDLDFSLLHSSRRPLIFPKIVGMQHNSSGTTAESVSSVEKGIVVGGCEKQSANRFALDLGVQSYSSGRVRGVINLGNQSQDSVQYKIKPVKDTDLRWLSLSHSSGKIEGKSSVSVVVWCSTDVLAVHSSYIVLENLDDDRDVKLIRVKMDVVQQHVDELTSFFSLYASKTDDEGWYQPEIDLGDVYQGHLYRARSFVIRNNTNQKLELGMTVNQNEGDTNELKFSTSYTVPKLISNLTLGTQESKSIHVFFCPRPREMTETFEFEADLVVQCRLVKESEKHIPFRCRVRRPQLELEPRQSEFEMRHIDVMRTSMLASKGGKKEFEEAIGSLKDQKHRVTITNLFGDEKPLVVGIFSNAAHLQILDGDGNVLERGHQLTVEGSKALELEVVANMEMLKQNWRTFLEDEYQEEHFYVYNAEEMSEKYLHRVRFATGEPLSELYQMPGENLSRPMNQMEEHISLFFVQFTAFWNSVEKQVEMELSGQEFWHSLEELLASQDVQEEEMGLYREYHFLTDELIYHGLRSNRMNTHVFELSETVFGFVLNQRIIERVLDAHQEVEVVRRWIGRAKAFLNHFPDVKMSWLAGKIRDVE